MKKTTSSKIVFAIIVFISAYYMLCSCSNYKGDSNRKETIQTENSAGIVFKSGINIFDSSDITKSNISLKSGSNSCNMYPPPYTEYEELSDICNTVSYYKHTVFLKIHVNKSQSFSVVNDVEEPTEIDNWGKWLISGEILNVIDIAAKNHNNEDSDEYNGLIGRNITLLQPAFVMNLKNSNVIYFLDTPCYLLAEDVDVIVRFNVQPSEPSFENMVEEFEEIENVFWGENRLDSVEEYRKLEKFLWYGVINDFYPAIDLNGNSIDTWQDFLNSLRILDEYFSQQKKASDGYREAIKKFGDTMPELRGYFGRRDSFENNILIPLSTTYIK